MYIVFNAFKWAYRLNYEKAFGGSAKAKESRWDKGRRSDRPELPIAIWILACNRNARERVSHLIEEE